MVEKCKAAAASFRVERILYIHPQRERERAVEFKENNWTEFDWKMNMTMMQQADVIKPMKKQRR